jgi:hypothetical protein
MFLVCATMGGEEDPTTYDASQEKTGLRLEEVE